MTDPRIAAASFVEMDQDADDERWLMMGLHMNSDSPWVVFGDALWGRASEVVKNRLRAEAKRMGMEIENDKPGYSDHETHVEKLTGRKSMFHEGDVVNIPMEGE